MLVELKLVEQRYRAVIDVLDGMTVTDVARRNGVSRQTVHTWLRRYANGGMAALADKSSKPESCPHQMAPLIEARVVELRRAHPRWGPRTIRTHLAKEGFTPVPGRSSIYRTLVRHHLLEPTPRKRSRSDYKRWERSRSMELWQMDVVGRFHLADGTEVKVVTGVDDHSRFCVCARVVARATARPVCEALQWALRTHGVPDQILTDNGKVFTARFGQGPGPVLFDRICANNGIRHIAHRSVLADHDGQGGALPQDHALGLLGRPRPGARHHRGAPERPRRLGRRVQHDAAAPVAGRPPTDRALRSGCRPPRRRISRCPRSATRSRSRSGRPESTAGSTNAARSGSEGCAIGWARPSPGSPSRWSCASGLVEILHAGVLVATHAERRRADNGSQPQRAVRAGRSRPPTRGMTVTRRVDGGGSVSFAGAGYRVGRSWARQLVEVAIVAGSVQISAKGKVIRVHAIRHDRSKEHGAFATPQGRPRKAKVA